MLHERVGAALEEVSAGRLEDQFQELAHHYGRSRNHPKAVEYMRLAGEQALTRSHLGEALSYARTALNLLGGIPDSALRLRAEMALQLILSKEGLVGKWESLSGAERALTRAYQISQQIAGASQTFPVLANLWTLTFLRGELAKSHELATQLLEIARKEQSELLQMEAHFALGDTLYWQGRFREALANFEQVAGGYWSAMGMLNIYGWDSVALALGYSGLCRWHLGHPDEDLPMIERAIQRARTLGHTFTMLVVRNCACKLRLLRRESVAAQSEAELFSGLVADAGVPGDPRVAKAYSHCATLQQTPTLSTLAKLLEVFRVVSQDTKLMSPIFLGSLAEGYGRIGEIETGLEKIADALALIEISGERHREAELYRLKGELLQKRDLPSPSEAEACFRKAIEVARRQEAKMFELRATMSLARLLAGQARRDEAHAMLSEIYNWFTEGFDTSDLRDAKALLDELSE
jgi:tetratricopeptide (TPR) repeat protein